MDKTAAAIKSFLHKSDHHDTTVHENVAPAVQHETVKPTRHEEVNTAVDREVHQDHHHTIVQPVHDKQVLPEKHVHNVGAVEHREFDHRNHEHTKQTLAAEAGKFKDERTVAGTTHTKSNAAIAQGEHVHHHVHETIQPVIHKETIQPEVVHTTVPIHEVHHNAAQHHGTTHLPAVSMSEFKKQGGVLGGRSERSDAFDGCPKGAHTHADGTTHEGRSKRLGRSGSSSSSSSSDGEYTTHKGKKNSAALAGATAATAGAAGTTGTTSTTGAQPAAKPKLLDRLNPLKDADGDGKKGIMT